MLYRQSRTALLTPVRTTLCKVLDQKVKDLAESNRKGVASVLRAVHDCPEFGLTVGPTTEQLEVAVRFFIPSELRAGLCDDSWLDAFGTNSFDTSFKTQHATLYGKDPYAGFFVKRDTYSNIYKLELPIEPPFTIDGQTPLAHEHEEVLNTMLGYVMTLRREFPDWAEQFRTENTKNAPSYAAYYSSTVSNWLKSMDKVVTPYVRRPSVEYTRAMSPELNTVLSVALSLKDAKGVEESYS